MNYYYEHYGAELLPGGKVKIKCVCGKTFVCGPRKIENYLFTCPFCEELYHLETPTHIIRAKTNSVLSLIEKSGFGNGDD